MIRGGTPAPAPRARIVPQPGVDTLSKFTGGVPLLDLDAYPSTVPGPGPQRARIGDYPLWPVVSEGPPPRIQEVVGFPTLARFRGEALPTDGDAALDRAGVPEDATAAARRFAAASAPTRSPLAAVPGPSGPSGPPFGPTPPSTPGLVVPGPAPTTPFPGPTLRQDSPAAGGAEEFR